MSQSRTRSRERALASAFMWAIPLALAVTAAVETLGVPAQSGGSMLRLFGRSLWSCYLLLWPLSLFQLALAGLFAFGHRLDERPERLRAVVAAVAGALAIGHVYLQLTSYEPFAGYPPFVALFAGLWAVVTAVVVLVPHRSRGPILIAAAVLAAGGACVYALDDALYVGHYPTLHLAAIRTAHLLLQLGLALGLAAIPRTAGRIPRVAAAIALAAILVSPAWLALGEGWARTASEHARHTTLGHALALCERAGATGDAAHFAMDDAEALGEFANSSGLPELPPGFDIGRYNVLLISWEATRLDQTSLGDPALGTTPRLLEYFRRGAYSFDRAYSPSSITLQSVAALFSMTLPSATRLAVGQKSWDGTLLPEAETLAELFARAGYGTFWIGHDRNACFTDVIHGYEQGFDEVRLILERKSNRTRSPEYGNPSSVERPVDEQVVDALLAEIDRRAAAGDRFFGWTFLVSPHAEYLAHYPDRPARTDLDRYRQELSYADQQTGRILDHLRETGLDRTTVVVILGDHGEEFGERGGRFHGSTLYDEQVRVPLLVRLPGVAGQRIDRPTSPMYVFPWLLLSGPNLLREAALARIRGEIAPVMRAIDGGVPMEILSRDKMANGLAYRDRKGIHHLISGAIEVYDPAADPGETANLAATLPGEAARFAERFSRYEEVRRAIQRYRLLED